MKNQMANYRLVNLASISVEKKMTNNLDFVFSQFFSGYHKNKNLIFIELFSIYTLIILYC